MQSRMAKIAQLALSAPVDPTAWAGALSGLAEIAGGWSGELVGISNAGFRFYLSTENLPAELQLEYAARDGANPAVNPRAAAMQRAPVLRPMVDPHFISDERRAKHPLYQEFLEPVEAAYAHLGLLAAEGDLRVVASVNRSRKQGVATQGELDRFGALFPYFRAASLLQIRLENQAAAISLGALEALSIPAILCDEHGKIAGASPEAEALLREGRFLRMVGGRLSGACFQSSQALGAAIAKAGAFAPDLELSASRVLLSSADGEAHLSADITPLPQGRHGFGAFARVLVAIARPAPQKDEVLIRLGLTESEAHVARALVSGLSPVEIASQRDTSVATVRSQLKAVYAKLGVRRQLELAAKLKQIG